MYSARWDCNVVKRGRVAEMRQGHILSECDDRVKFPQTTQLQHVLGENAYTQGLWLARCPLSFMCVYSSQLGIYYAHNWTGRHPCQIAVTMLDLPRQRRNIGASVDTWGYALSELCLNSSFSASFDIDIVTLIPETSWRSGFCAALT